MCSSTNYNYYQNVLPLKHFPLAKYQPVGCLHEHKAVTLAHCECRCSQSSQGKYTHPVQAWKCASSCLLSLKCHSDKTGVDSM